MNRKLKIMYWGVMAFCAIALAVNIITANFLGAALNGLILIWIITCYRLTILIYKQNAMINELLKTLEETATTLRESNTR